MKLDGYEVLMVTAEDVANGVVKGETLYLHSLAAPEIGLFIRSFHDEDGIPLDKSQVRLLPGASLEWVEKDEPVENTEEPFSFDIEADALVLTGDEVREIAEELDLPPAQPTSERGLGLKFDGGKPRPSLLIRGMPRALEKVIDVLTFGAKKYAAHSWQHVENGQERYEDAKLRHMFAEARGEKFDRESRIEHLAHEACNILFLLELELKNKENN